MCRVIHISKNNKLLKKYQVGPTLISMILKIVNTLLFLLKNGFSVLFELKFLDSHRDN